MTIAKAGKFNLCTSTYLDNSKEVSNHQLNIGCYYKENNYNQIIIAQFNEKGEIYSIDNRLFEEINTYKDVEDIRTLEAIAQLIILKTDPIIIYTIV